jgi:Protein of unknown function (DUF4058)
MTMPFPGMDPYLEHPILWTGVHSGLISSIRSQLAPRLRPRYVASIEERVMIDIPQHQRIPDLWVQKVSEVASTTGTAVSLEEPLVMEIADDPVKEHYIEILDRYQDLKAVTVIEVVSPINKAAGPGSDEYLRKRKATLQSSTHLVEIDLLRRGDRIVAFSDEQLESIGPFDYLVTVNRFQPGRTQYEIIPRRLRNPLPTFGLPLVAPDPDVPLDLQAALDRVYEDGSYMLRVHYERPCSPSLEAPDQQWAAEQWAEYRNRHQELFG